MFWLHVVSIFDSNFFVGLVTLIVGTFAYGVYRKRKRDVKRDAANIILLEIEGVEQQLQSQRISEEKPFTDVDEADIYLMPQMSWEKYKYLFVRDLDRNEWDKVSGFYAKCQDYDNALKDNNTGLDRNRQALRVNMQRILADYADDYSRGLTGKTDTERVKLEEDYIALRKQFTDAYMNTQPTHMYTYVPVKPMNDAIRALKGLDASMSLTSIGIKLKRMAYRKSWWQRIKFFVADA